ncbi:hypothetical protein Hanom_Chr09g00863161 [Helianthus anomalus]
MDRNRSSNTSSLQKQNLLSLYEVSEPVIIRHDLNLFRNWLSSSFLKACNRVFP